MHTIEATYRINTPMFIAGADQNKEAELRLPSFKGALRFWWRALAYGRYEGDLAQIKKTEDEIFGSTKGQAKFLFRLDPVELLHVNIGNKDIISDKSNGLIYLGYGICEPFTNPRRGTEKGRLTKSCLTENQNFKVIVSWRDITKDYSNEEYTKIISLMKDSLKIIGLLGGLGSKARKGFGSLTLLSFIDEYNKSSYSHPMTRDDLSKVINEILPYDKLPAKQPPFSAFSQYTRIIILENRNDPKQLLNSIGLKMQRYRSWGSNGRVNNENAEKNFKNDHDLAIEISNKTRINEHPKRIMFGLPHNYFFSSNSAKVNFDAEGNLSDRRASPLFLHIHDCINKNYLAIAMIMDSLFLSNEIKIKAKLLERHNPFQLIFDCKEDYSVLHEFIDGRIGPRDNKTKEYYFPNRLTILGKQVNKEGSK